MGMFDKPQYLTGKDGYVEPGDEFYLHAAKIEGTVMMNGAPKHQAKLKVSRDGKNTEIVYSSGNGIVGQVQRMDDDDRAAMPMKVRLDEVPSKQGNNKARVITPADQPAPSDVSSGDDF